MVLGLGTAISNTMVQGFQSPVFGSPKDDFGLDYKDVEFQNKDGKTLRGWLIEPKDDNVTEKKKKIIIQSHFGVLCCRSGYTPEGKGMMAMFSKKIEFLKAVPHYLEKGYAILMYDMSNHGNSDAGSCPYISWGPNEAYDVLAAVQYAVQSFDEVYLLSICMGGGASTYAYGLENGLQTFNDKIKAMIVVQPLLYSNMIENMGFPKWLDSMSTPVTTERLGFDLNAKSFMDDVPKITVPTLVIQNNADPFHRHDQVQAYYDALTVEKKEIKWLDLEKDRLAAYAWVSEHPQDVLEWFNQF